MRIIQTSIWITGSTFKKVRRGSICKSVIRFRQIVNCTHLIFSQTHVDGLGASRWQHCNPSPSCGCRYRSWRHSCSHGPCIGLLWMFANPDLRDVTCSKWGSGPAPSLQARAVKFCFLSCCLLGTATKKILTRPSRRQMGRAEKPASSLSGPQQTSPASFRYKVAGPQKRTLLLISK